MSPAAVHTLVLARFECTRALRARATRVAAVLLPAVMLLALFASGARGTAVPADLFGYACVAALTVALNLGMAADHALHFDEFVVLDFASSKSYLAAKLLAYGALLLAFFAYALLCGLIFFRGDAVLALWYATAFTLLGVLLLPGILVMELLGAAQLPAAAFLVLFAVALLAAEPIWGAGRLLELLGLRLRPGSFASFGSLALRTVTLVPLGILLLYPAVAARLRVHATA